MERKEIVVNDRIFKVENKTMPKHKGKCLRLGDVYKTFSVYKAQAWNYCENLCKMFKGNNLTVCSHNCMMFSASFDFTHNGEDYVMYITKSYDRVYRVA